MMSFKDLEASEMVWRQPNRKAPLYELHAEDTLVARITWEKKRGARAIAESDDGRWAIDKQGVLRPRILIQTVGSSVDLATFRGNWSGGGTLEFRDGRRFAWDNTNFLHTAWHWTDRLNHSLLSFKGKKMTLEPAGRTLPEISLLATLSWYLNIMNTQSGDGAAVVAMGASTASL